MNVTEPDILRLQAAQWFQRILRASADQRSPTACSCSRHPEVPQEQPEEPRPTFESAVEFLQLLDESLLQVVLVATADEFRLAGIRKDGDCSAGGFNKLRFGAEIDAVADLRSDEDVQISIEFFSVIARNQNDRGLVTHLNQCLNPEVSFIAGLLVSRQVSVDHKQVHVGTNGVGHKPVQALSGVAEVVILLQVHVTDMCRPQKFHTTLLFPPPCELSG